ncbi:alpha/beta hydrolase [Plectonema cf. radiosum LEGE 06105]|uniref:Alpha/beta hydrolase n=1 Tax=Plectonema cf. radiosum LEGE 06105 TaxID=945769 RepID=A0A8J7JRN3_9CYAN|nr:CocE/NonD family hydrolase [Plectonema radiosum]MBE9211529.1 alpha/beta hydrolase [Plectonema cf. radiosum LEGE 06105]
MKFASRTIHTFALSLILLAGSAYAQTQNLESSQNLVQIRQVSDIAIAANNYKPGINRVTFQSEGEKLVGNLYLPASYKPGDKLPTVVVTGAWMTIKEQMPATYAQKLADEGFAAFAFDFRTFGESGGKLRGLESPTEKIKDIQNAVGFLQTVDAVDNNKIAGLGICASAGYMVEAAANDSRIKSLITVAPWIHSPEIVNTVYGGEKAVQEKIKIGETARKQFEQTGKAEVVPAASKTNKKAPMFGEVPYYTDSQRGAIPQWDNEFAVMSWKEWLTFNPMPQAKNINVPTLFVHSEKAAIPDGARQFFQYIPVENKKFVWLENRTQFDFYDQESTVNQSVLQIVNHLQSTL